MRAPFRPRAAALAAGLAALAAAAIVVTDSDTARSAFPGDNGLIVFSSERPAGDGSTDFEVYAMRPDGSDVRQLTDNGLAPASDEGDEGGEHGEGSGPPEGRGGPPNGMGGGEEDEGEGPVPINDIHPAVSPDGTHIAFSSNRPAPDGSTDPEIYIMRLDGTGVVQVTDTRPGSGSGAEYEPAWSPDGTKLVFRRGDGAKADLYVKDLATGTETALVIPPTTHGRRAYDAQPSWSPDGRRIVFRKGFGPATGVWVYDLVTGLAVELADEAEISESQPNWSPDGARVAYVRGDDSAGAAIWVVNADGTSPRPLTDPVVRSLGTPVARAHETEGGVPMYSDHAPAWSPDGTRIAFQSTRDGRIKPVEEPEATVAADEDEGHGEQPSEHFDPGNIEIYTMNADGTDQRRLTKDPETSGPEDVTPDWAPIPRAAGSQTPPAVGAASGAPDVQVVAVSQTAPRVCKSRRRFEIRLSKRVRRAEVVSTAVYVNGKPVKVRYADGRLRSTIDLRGLPRGRYEVKAVIRVRKAVTVTRNGRKVRTRRLVETRSYRTCVPRRP